MVHYVCTGGCGGVSDHSKNCGAESCSRFNQPLVECNCADGSHLKARSDEYTADSE